MRSLVFLASVLWVGSVFGGTITEAPRFTGPADRTMSFSGDIAYVQSINKVFDSTIAFIDIIGTAQRMDLASPRYADGRPTAHFDVFASAQPEDLGNGITRFSFRGQGLKTEYEKVGDTWLTRSMRMVLHEGTISAGETLNDPSKGILNSYLWNTAYDIAGDIPLGWTWVGMALETLDPPFGDATGDGRIDINDFGTLKDGFGQPTTPYQNGDVTGNLTVDMTDFGILKQNFGWKQAAVPEPSGWVLAVLAAVGAVVSRRPRSLREHRRTRTARNERGECVRSPSTIIPWPVLKRPTLAGSQSPRDNWGRVAGEGSHESRRSTAVAASRARRSRCGGTLRSNRLEDVSEYPVRNRAGNRVDILGEELLPPVAYGDARPF
jgi:hypothetical protein